MQDPEKVNGVKAGAENLPDHVSDYLATYLKLTELNATQKATEVATISFTAMLISFFGMIIMIFLGLGLAQWFEEFMSAKKGYFMVALVYTFFTVVVLACRKRFIFPFLRNQIVSKIYERNH